ncbi:MAG: hypothetical protein GY803_07785 [Chloroflexi bacterium]|nr:hypothetical protein [Chloroflexota bacterium]
MQKIDLSLSFFLADLSSFLVVAEFRAADTLTQGKAVRQEFLPNEIRRLKLKRAASALNRLLAWLVRFSVFVLAAWE